MFFNTRLLLLRFGAQASFFFADTTHLSVISFEGNYPRIARIVTNEESCQHFLEKIISSIKDSC